MAGARAELACHVDQQQCGQVYYITWTKQASNASQWTRVYLYTGDSAGPSGGGGGSSAAGSRPVGDLAGRATFVMPPAGAGESDSPSAGPPAPKPLARLIIDEPRLSDEALYKCDVTYVRGKCPSISLARLQMVAPPSRAQLFLQTHSAGQPHRLKLRPGQQVGTLSEGEQLQLVCQLRGGRPAPRALYWRKVDPLGRLVNLTPAAPLDGGQWAEELEQQVVEVLLNRTLEAGDLQSRFECHVEHEALEQLVPLARQLGANQQSQPTTTTTTSSGDALLDLHPAANQVAPNAQPGVELRGESGALDAHVIVDLNVGVSSLDLFLAKLSPSAGAELGTSLRLREQQQQQVLGARNASEPLAEGDLVELECVAHDSRPAANISWFNGNEQLLLGADEQQLAADSPTASSQRNGPVRLKRLLQRQQVSAGAQSHTFTTRSFLTLRLTRHEHRAQISCRATNQLAARRPTLVRSLELQVRRKFWTRN